MTSGRHNLKFGMDLKQTRLLENFGFGVTDPDIQSRLHRRRRERRGPDPRCSIPAQCCADSGCVGESGSAGRYCVALRPDARRADCSISMRTQNINQYALYAQDAITAGNFVFNVGFRLDTTTASTSDNGAEPRAGIAYNIKKTGTVLRVGLCADFRNAIQRESAAVERDRERRAGAERIRHPTPMPIQPGRRNQFNTGLQQAIGKYLLIDADYFWKYTHNAYDFSTLLNTTITFPIAWHNSKLDGVTGRVSTTNLHGFQAYWTFGHTRARYFSAGERRPDSARDSAGGGVFRIDHDQAFQSTGVFRYQTEECGVDRVHLALRQRTGGERSARVRTRRWRSRRISRRSIGLSCDGVFATFASPDHELQRRRACRS